MYKGIFEYTYIPRSIYIHIDTHTRAHTHIHPKQRQNQTHTSGDRASSSHLCFGGAGGSCLSFLCSTASSSSSYMSSHFARSGPGADDSAFVLSPSLRWVGNKCVITQPRWVGKRCVITQPKVGR